MCLKFYRWFTFMLICFLHRRSVQGAYHDKCTVKSLILLHPTIAALPHEHTCRCVLSVLLNDYLCLCTKFILSTRQWRKAYDTQFKLSTTHINSNVATAFFTLKHYKQVAIRQQVPSTTSPAAGCGKLNFSHCTPWRRLGNEGIAPLILNLGTTGRSRWVDTFTPLPLYPCGKSPLYLSNNRCFFSRVKKKKYSLAPTSHSPDTTPTALRNVSGKEKYVNFTKLCLWIGL